MEEVEVRAKQLASQCVALLDEMFRPRSSSVEAEVAELKAAGVAQHTIDTLYPIELRDYALGIQNFAVLATSIYDVLDATSLASLTDLEVRLKPELAETLRAEREKVEAPTLLPTVIGYLRLLNSAPLSELLLVPSGSTLKEDGAWVVANLGSVLSDLQELHRYKLLLEEGDPNRRLMLRLRFFKERFFPTRTR